MIDRDQRVKALLDEIERLLEQSKRATDERLPRWRRILGAHRSAVLLRRASELMDEIDAIKGNPRPAEKWLGFGRKGWARWQFGVGVCNAWGAVDSLVKHQWLFAAISGVCIIVCAHWRLPYEPPKERK